MFHLTIRLYIAMCVFLKNIGIQNDNVNCSVAYRAEQFKLIVNFEITLAVIKYRSCINYSYLRNKTKYLE